MTVTLAGIRKVAVIKWDTNVVVGESASLQVEGQGEKRNVDNDGESNLFFPLTFKGSVDIVVRGSSAGEDRGTIEVE
jgi:hypothetical protein